MTGYIQRIETQIPHSDRVAEINVQGRHIIFTGSNGCGKTQLITALHEYLNQKIVRRENYDVSALHRKLTARKQQLDLTSRASPNYESLNVQLANIKKQIDFAESKTIQLNELEDFIIRYHDNKAFLLFFNATRQAQIRKSNGVQSLAELIKRELQQKNHSEKAGQFEEYLVSNKTAQAYAESLSIDNNPEEATRINNWFKKLQNDFRELFEDNSLTLTFNSKEQAFYLKQGRKAPYRLQQLSSGYSAILSVYADLLTKIELRSINPGEMKGIVFIDEIDAHLHVSLQRKILSFLTNAFPNIQFIVTTHSPFVVSSVSNAVIYDLSTLEQVDDLSMYSYEAVLEGLFGVSPISEMLKQKLTELTDEVKKSFFDIKKVESLISNIRKNEFSLNSESMFLLESAQLQLTKAKAGKK